MNKKSKFNSFKVTDSYYEIDMPKGKGEPVYSQCHECKKNFAEMDWEYLPECPICGKAREIISQV